MNQVSNPRPASTGAFNAYEVTPSNTVDLAVPSWNGLYTAGVGTVKVDTVGGQIGVTFTAVAGGHLPVAAKRVYATGTSATGIVALA